MRYVYKFHEENFPTQFKVFETEDLGMVKSAIRLMAELYIKNINNIESERLNIINEHKTFEQDDSVNSQLQKSLNTVMEKYTVKIGDYVIHASDFVATKYSLEHGFTHNVIWPTFWTIDEWFEEIANSCKS